MRLLVEQMKVAAIVLLGEVGDVVKGGNLREFAGLGTIGGVDLEG